MINYSGKNMITNTYLSMKDQFNPEHNMFKI